MAAAAIKGSTRDRRRDGDTGSGRYSKRVIDKDKVAIVKLPKNGKDGAKMGPYVLICSQPKRYLDDR
jgi:hypothetical protein